MIIGEKRVFEAIKESDTIIGELARTWDEGMEDLQEFCTDGFVEIVIKGNMDYKTSFEIRDEADEKIAKAGTRYFKRCKAFNKYLDAFNKYINDLYEKKVALAKRMHQKAAMVKTAPNLAGIVTSPVYKYVPSTNVTLCERLGLAGRSDIKGRQAAAKEYREEAKDFAVEMNGKIVEIDRIEAYLDTVKMNLQEEEKIIAALNDSLNKNRAMKYDDIEKQLHVLISEYVLDSSGKRNEKYMAALEQMKQLN